MFIVKRNPTFLERSGNRLSRETTGTIEIREHKALIGVRSLAFYAEIKWNS